VASEIVTDFNFVALLHHIHRNDYNRGIAFVDLKEI